MSNEAFKKVARDLREAIAHVKGEGTGAVVHFAQDGDVGAVREKTELSQEDFARTFGVSLGTLRNWEQGRRVPDRPARVLLTLINRDPVAVLKTLQGGAEGRGSGAFTEGTHANAPRRLTQRAADRRRDRPPSAGGQLARRPRLTERRCFPNAARAGKAPGRTCMGSLRWTGSSLIFVRRRHRLRCPTKQTCHSLEK
jgi:putative transcriptional regulator